MSAAAASAPQPATSALAEKAQAGAAPAATEKNTQEEKDEARWQPVMGLTCELTVELALPGFKVSDLLRLGPGSVLGSHWGIRRDVPLRINGTLIGWSEFEVVGDRLAVRVTDLA